MQLFVQSLLSRRTLCVHFDDSFPQTVDVQATIAEREGVPGHWLQLLRHGRRLEPGERLRPGDWLRCVSTLPGGKGGFGSMLRAIGAQIEKTTNREACRDLSGRRLRDINHETRLKRWVARQAEAQRERRRPPEAPRHTLDDPEFQRQRDLLPDRVQEAVSHGLTVGSKRPKTGGGPPKKRRAPLWLGAPEMPSSEDSGEEEEEEKESGGEGESQEQGEGTGKRTDESDGPAGEAGGSDQPRKSPSPP
uniref:Putative signal transducer n=1 Tax=Ixodes ricinus TaxID=34613 RepID=A0A6B0V4Y3_IXORI